MNSKKTSNRVGSLAGQVLQNQHSSAIQRQLAGSALAQRQGSKQTGGGMEDVASKVLNSPKYNDTTKELAGSVLAQSNRKR
ncbi:hypothetical protein [Azotosporobacter soli]|uniref:hypothetical protein n=1 Tax=Azotosporobacter soli TaxID=3055040 RepID=UPI0031FED780